MKKTSKILSIIIIVMALLTITTNVIAATGTNVKPDAINGTSDVILIQHLLHC